MKKKSNWLFVDLVEDKIKNRGIFITVSLMFYVYITWRLIVGFPSINNTPATIDPYLDMPRITFMGIDVSKQRTPQVKITNSYGEALQGVNVTINLVKISTDSTKVSTPI